LDRGVHAREAGGVLVTRSPQLLGCSAFLIALAMLPVRAAAQTTSNTPSVEISAGLQFLHIPDETYPFGWNLDLSGPLGSHELVRWVGEGGMSHDHPLPVADSLSFYHLGAGVRFMPADRRRAAPFFQLLAGAAYASARQSTNPNIATTNGEWAPMIQPGIGVSVPMNRYLAIVGQGDYRFAIFRGQTDNEFRVAFGARFMLW
jgi:hypothetical protein